MKISGGARDSERVKQRVIRYYCKRMGAARFGHRTPGPLLGLPHPALSRAPHGGADDEAQVSRARPGRFGPS
jgi:hypothetical protein